MFYNYNPVKLIHGKNSIQRAITELPTNSIIAVLHGATLERIGSEVIDTISTLAPSRVVWIRMDSGEPTEASLDALVSAIPSGTTFLMGIGGGSVMDSTKGAAVCLGNKLNAAELKTSSPMSWNKTMKFGLVSTRPGSGSELNNAFVVMDELTRYKRTYFSIYSYAAFSIHDPFFYQTLEPKDFANGLADAVSHVIDQYLVDREKNTVQDLMSQNFLCIGKELSKRAPSPSAVDFLQLAWFSSLVSSGVLSRGVKTSWILHEVAHSLASVQGLTHTHSLTTVSRAVLSLPRHPQERLQQVANILSKEEVNEKNSLSESDRISIFFSDLELPVGIGFLKQAEIEIWRKAMGTLCPNLTNEEVSYLCMHP
jgi:NADP-dependent alcohol dehydrogenase